MTLKELDLMRKKYQSELDFDGHCHDCGCDVRVSTSVKNGELVISGGAIYKPADQIFLKCDACFAKNKTLEKFQDCEIYSRIVGYLRPIKNWNNAKRAEYKLRKNANMEKL
jgi:hypothetical protein